MGVILIVLGGLIALGNLSVPFVARRTGRNVSMVPLIGGILLAIGIYTVTKSAWWALTGFALDVGSIACVIWLPMFAGDFWSRSR